MPNFVELYSFFISIFPLATFFLLVLLGRFSLFKSSLYSFILMLFITAFFWKIVPFALLGALLKSFVSTFEIIFIIFGALTLNYVLEHTRFMKTIKLTISKSSKDSILSMLVIAWFFVAFIEGIAGFGLPAVLAAPLLVSLGLSPSTAIIISLLGDSVAVSYGAVGVPINKGILLTIPAGQLSDYLRISVQEIANQIALKNALYHLFISSFVPLIMIYFILKDLKKPLRNIKKYLIPSIVAGLSVTFFMYLTILFVNETLASILASLIGLTLFLFLYERSFLYKLLFNKIKGISEFKIFEAFSPYAFLVVLLLILKLPYLRFLNNFALFKVAKLGSIPLNLEFNPFMSPGLSFVIVTLFFYFALKRRFSLKKAFSTSFNKIRNTFITLFLVISLVQMMIFSSYGYFYLAPNQSILEVTSNGLVFFVSALSRIVPFGDNLNYFLPGLLGLMGASLAGSATVSNILFSNISIALLSDPIKALALQNIGASLGNLTSLYNILIVSSIVGLVGLEFKILKKTLPLAIGFYLGSVLLCVLGIC